MIITKYRRSRFWAVQEADGTLVCLCVYCKGAKEVVRRLTIPDPVSEVTQENTTPGNTPGNTQDSKGAASEYVG